MTVARPFEILPAIDLRGGGVVRLRQGDFARATGYGVDATVVADAFVASGATWLHVVDLDGARSGTPENGPTIAAILATVGGRARVEIAGGLRTDAAVTAALASGAHRVVVGTAGLHDPAFIKRLVTSHGAERIVVAIDVRDGRAVGDGWVSDAPGIDVVDAIERLADAGAETFEVTAIARDGLLGGPDLDLYRRLVGRRASIIASGGITTLGDLAAVRDLGCDAAIIGRAIYEGHIDLRDALALAATMDRPIA